MLDEIFQENTERLFPLHKKTKFSIKDFLSKCDQIRRKRNIWMIEFYMEVYSDQEAIKNSLNKMMV